MKSDPHSPPGLSTRHRRPSECGEGFTLVEVLIAMVILGIGIVGVAGAQLTAMKFSRDSRARTQSMLFAEEQIERFNGMSPANVLAAVSDAGYPNDPGNPFSAMGDPNPYNRSWTISDDTPEVGVISITVNVTWIDSINVTRTTTLRTLKARR